MAATKRLSKELQDIKAANLAVFKSIDVSENNLFLWKGLIVPTTSPYNLGAFRIQIDYPEDYPFKPPKITFQTPIYHPNVDEEGQVCLTIILPENWKPATKTDEVVKALERLIGQPEPDHPLRAQLAEEYCKNRSSFMSKAEQHTRQHAERRP